MVERDFVVIGWVKHQVLNSVTDLISFWVVVGQADANQREASLKSDPPPKRLPCEESNSIHWTDRMAAADGKMKNVVGMSQEGLLGNSPDTIYRRGLLGFSVAERISAVEWLKKAVTIWIWVDLLSMLPISTVRTAAE